MMWDFARELHLALRHLLRAPGPTVGMLISLGVGVGTCTTVFGWINATLLEPFPVVARSGEYMVLAARTSSGTLEPLSYPGFIDLRNSAGVFDNLVAAGVTLNALNVGDSTQDGHTERVFANFVSGNYFSSLGVNVELGRAFRPDEDSVAGRDAVIVISHGLWQRRFAGIAGVVGQTVRLNGIPHTVIGVADRGFTGTVVGLSVDLWIPIAMQPTLAPGAASLDDRGTRWVVGLGRLKPEISRGEIDARLLAASRSLSTRYPDSDDREATLVPIWRSPWGAQGGTGPVLLLFAGVVGFLLMLSCANAANLLLVRAVGRRREMALRLAMGASRLRVTQQLLTESLLLALTAGVVGLLVAYLSSDLILFFLPPTDSPFVFGRGVDGAVVAFGLTLAMLTVVLFGLAPALAASRADVVTALKEESVTTAPMRSRLRATLVVVQVALCVVLLVGAGLFLRSLQQARRVSPGFTADDVLLATYDLSPLGYDSQRGAILHRELVASAARIAGVETISSASRVPLGFTPVRSVKVAVDGYVPAPGEDVIAGVNVIGPEYFRTLRISVRNGREFSDADTSNSEAVAIVNETMARRYWTTRDVIGSSLRADNRTVRVVGVVADSKYRALTEEPTPHLYLPATQNYEPRMTMHLKTTARTEVVLPLLRADVQRLDPALVLSNVQSMQTHMGFATLVPRMSASLLAAFGGLALFVATLGVYGVVAFNAAARRRELGIRLAIGATPQSIGWLMIGDGLKLALLGTVVGVALAWAMARLIAGLLVGVELLDPLVFGGVTVVLITAAAIAALAPAVRASRLDAVNTLRA